MDGQPIQHRDITAVTTISTSDNANYWSNNNHPCLTNVEGTGEGNRSDGGRTTPDCDGGLGSKIGWDESENVKQEDKELTESLYKPASVATKRGHHWVVLWNTMWVSSLHVDIIFCIFPGQMSNLAQLQPPLFINGPLASIKIWSIGTLAPSLETM